MYYSKCTRCTERRLDRHRSIALPFSLRATRWRTVCAGLFRGKPLRRFIVKLLMTITNPRESRTIQRCKATWKIPRDPCSHAEHAEQMSAGRSRDFVQDSRLRPTITTPLKGSPQRLGRNVRTIARMAVGLVMY